MARDRQRAKQRQAQRREARLAARRATGQPTRDILGQPVDEPGGPLPDGAGAPPENVGRSDTVAESPPPAPILDAEPDRDESEFDEEPEGFDEELDAPEDDEDGAGGGPPQRPTGRRGEAVPPGRPTQGAGLGRVFSFLRACWAELQRVQWPDRKALTQLTGIVIFFVILAGAYLGALDAVFQKLVQAIL
jgi:preprotein translocase subunit SecE